MKKFLAFVMAASMALSLAACGGSSASTATSTTTEATSEAAASTSGSKTDVAFVTDVGNIDDQSFNQYTWQGVQDFCSANSLNANYYRPSEDSDAARLEQIDIFTGVKRMAFDDAVNVSVELPIDRTSVDHGTAFDIAGKGVANADSLVDAVEYAVKLLEGRRQRDAKK